ncbi:MAG TPA: HAD hydrolase-like protein [Asticcacaulis sp.]|nr:HAD hydrolase-like protein [Asticcacaulis sp.]
MPPCRLIIFDFDGTLADSFGWFLDTFDTIADRFDFKRLDRSRIEDFRHLDARELMRLHGVPLWKVPMIAAHARTLQSHNLDTIKLFDGMAQVVAELHAKGIVIAVVTSNARANVETVLGTDLTTRIDHFACGASLFGKVGKFKALLQSLDLKPHDALAIGDELRDIEAARAAGIKAGTVAWGYTAPERLMAEKPDYLFETPADITALFQIAP